jgi:hypothetical protein
MAVSLLASPGDARAQAPAPGAPEPLSWYGDPSAPDISGVWVLVDSVGGTSPASRSKEGWRPWPPPLKAPFKAVWQKRVAEAAAGKRTDDPIRVCLPPGMPRFITGTIGPMLIIQTPGRVMLYRDGIPVRRVWLDGRGNPQPRDLELFSNGNAIGRYEGSDLVTEVIGILDQPIDSTGIPHSEDLTVVERFRRVDAKTLTVEVTLTDPTAFSRSMTSTATYKAFDGQYWEPKEFICTPETAYHPEAYVR